MKGLLQTSALVLDIPGREAGQALDLEIDEGQCWGVLGPNGAGKTTLLLTLAGLKAPRSGRIQLRSGAIDALSRRQIARAIGISLQTQHDEFPATVLETTLLGRHPHLRAWQRAGPHDHRQALEALAAVDLSHFQHRELHTLSGGERQRVALATLLTQDAPLWLLDEPTNHLDLHHQVALLDILSTRLRSGPYAAVLSLHDPNLAARYCSHLMLLYPSGEICKGKTAEIFRRETLEYLLEHPLTALTGPDGRPWIVPRLGIDNRNPP
jgi:iron complex transport system ATP-binding protein